MATLTDVESSAAERQLPYTSVPTVSQAVIMAGGKGTRLYPYSALLPKPLMPLGDMPILELLLRQMQQAGITDVLIAVNHLRHLIEAFFGDGRKYDLRIRYFNEDKPLGTAGALGGMMDQLDENFIVSNGDLLTTMDIGMMAKGHCAIGADASIGVFQRENKIDFGLIEFDSEMRLSAYHEKPTSLYYVSMGVYVLRREAVWPLITPDTYLDMPTLLLALRAAEHDVRCFHHDGIWLDIGRPDDFALAQETFEKSRELFLR